MRKTPRPSGRGVAGGLTQGSDVLCAGAFSPTRVVDLVLDLLTFPERIEAALDHCGAVEKELIAVTGDKAEALLSDHLLDRSLRHVPTPLIKTNPEPAQPLQAARLTETASRST